MVNGGATKTNSDVVISVVIPCYKAEVVLERCVESVLRQTFQKIEIILVDDGSPAQTGAVPNAMVKQDYRIRVVHQPKDGIMATRYAGIVAAVGEWIAFVDSDDTLPCGCAAKSV